MSPTQRALKHCRDQGWHAQVVERWNPYARVRHDLFGCIDIVVLDGGPGGPLGVQVTSGAHVAARMAKAQAEPRIAAWVDSPARFEVWGYRKVGPRGKRKVWELRRVPYAPAPCATSTGSCSSSS